MGDDNHEQDMHASADKGAHGIQSLSTWHTVQYSLAWRSLVAPVYIWGKLTPSLIHPHPLILTLSSRSPGPKLEQHDCQPLSHPFQVGR